VVALKALPVLILGGLTSIPGAIVGGLIIGVGEKMGEFYWGPLLGAASNAGSLMRSRSHSCFSARRGCLGSGSSTGFEVAAHRDD